MPISVTDPPKELASSTFAPAPPTRLANSIPENRSVPTTPAPPTSEVADRVILVSPVAASVSLLAPPPSMESLPLLPRRKSSPVPPSIVTWPLNVEASMVSFPLPPVRLARLMLLRASLPRPVTVKLLSVRLKLSPPASPLAESTTQLVPPPDPPFKTSFPVPPPRVLFPAAPFSVTEPSVKPLALMESLPAPPVKLACSMSPARTSLPAKPVSEVLVKVKLPPLSTTESVPPLPVRLSLPESPMRMSLLEPPSSVSLPARPSSVTGPYE